MISNQTAAGGILLEERGRAREQNGAVGVPFGGLFSQMFCMQETHTYNTGTSNMSQKTRLVVQRFDNHLSWWIMCRGRSFNL